MVAGGAAGAPVETWTVLFTDQVGSTEMRVRVGEQAFDGIRGDLDARVTAALTAHGVVVTKPTGDGVMGGFTSTVAALRCAVAIQQAVADRNRTASEDVAGAERLALRIGISVGDAVVDNGDLQGTAVVEAARLCAAASGGTILCSEAVRVVSANRSGCSFGPVSPVQLKGLPGPVQVHEVNWVPLPYDPGEHRLAFRVLGPLEVLDADRRVEIGGPKERLVLALLLARVNSPVSVDALIDAVWGDRPPRTAERTVHAYVARLRRTLEPGRPRREPSTLLATAGHGYELRLDAQQLDATRFAQLAQRGSDEVVSGDDAAPSTLRQALGLWRGEVFGEFREVEACVAVGRRLEELRLGLVEDRVDADLAAGQSAELVGEIEALLRDEPFRERLWGQLMLALYRSGRQRDALDAYQRARRLLADELGIEPGPDLRRLEAAVLEQDPSLDVLRPAPPATVPGRLPAALAAVGPAFLGRESEVAWLREAWADAIDGRGGLVSVLGPEGIGKTRLVAELARDVHNDGAPVLYGRCDHAHRGSRALLGQALQSAGSSLAHIDGGAADEGDIAEAVTRHLPTWSQGRPVLVVLDDLHLADAETLEVVADLAGWCQAAPMLVVATFRSDASHPTSPAGPPGAKASQLALGPLASDAVGHICELYATEPWSAEDIDRLYDLTGGVPLLVHEQASEWARERAGRRMAEVTGRAAASRRRLLASRGEVADGVEGIQRLLEQRRAQLAGREAQLQATVVAALAGCPYKGLARFEESDAANFFGRERLVAELVARLAEARILAVVGPSGSGKSSLIRAGLLPALATGVLPGPQPWRSAILCPGPHPVRELARKLHETGGPADRPRVVFVDQFEETFTACAVRHQQDEFVARLLDVADQPDTAVVLAIRADHLDRCASFPELADRLDGNNVLVGPLRDSELRRTVELPAQRAGLEIEGGLVEVIVSEVAGRAGALPLLSTALAETWERREAQVLTLAGYRAAGGVNGALARMAEDAYTGLPAGPRGAARRLLLRLCDSGEDGDLTLRRRLPLDDAIDEHDTNATAALETLADRRLLTIDSDAVEVAHEALLREWPRLRTWLDEDVQGRRLHRRLHDAARSWDAADHDPSELYRGTRLGAATDWATHHDDELSQTERAFLDTSQAQSDQELDDARRQATTRARSNRRLRTLLAGIGILLVVALVAGLLAVRQADRADQQATIAEREGTVATARELSAAANANLEVDPERSILLALKAVEHTRAADGSVLPEAEEALHRAVTASRIVRSVSGVGGYLDWSPDGTVFVTEGPEDTGLVDIRDAQSGESVRSFHGHDVDVNDVAFSHNGSMLGTTGDDGAARVWDASTGKVLGSLEGRGLCRPRWGCPPDAEVWGPSFSPDGSLFAASWGREGVTRMMDLATGRTVREFGIEGADRTSFSPDGQRLAVASYSYSLGPEAVVVDIDSGDRLFSVTGHRGALTDIAWSPNGRWIATSSQDGSARIWDGESGTLRFTLYGHGAWIQDVDWSPDSKRLATASNDGTAKLWRITEEGTRELFSLSAQDLGSGARGVSFSPDGDQLMTGDESITAVKVWDVSRTGDAEWANLPSVPLFEGSATFMPDGRRLIASTADGSATVWDPATGARMLTFGPHGPWTDSGGAKVFAIDPFADDPSGADLLAIDVSSDGTLIATASADGIAKVWNAATGDEMFTVPSGPVATDVAWAPDGDLLATASVEANAGLVTVVDRTGKQVAALREESGVAFGSVEFSADGRRLLTSRVIVARPDPTVPEVRIWDWERGDVVRTIDAPAERAFYDATDTRIGITTRPPSGDGRVELLDSETGRRIATLADDTTGVMSIDFAPDGSIVATAGLDGAVRLWDPESGEQILVLRGHQALVSSVAFSSDGSQLASVSADGTVRVWAIDLDDLIEIAEKELTRTLTDDECQQYLHISPCA